MSISHFCEESEQPYRLGRLPWCQKPKFSGVGSGILGILAEY
jgi:hypothetical protein